MYEILGPWLKEIADLWSPCWKLFGSLDPARSKKWGRHFCFRWSLITNLCTEVSIDTSCGMSIGNIFSLAYVFTVFSTIQGKINGKAFSGENAAKCKMLLGCTIITVHAPGPHMWLCPGPGPCPSVPKQWKSDVHVKTESKNPVSARSPLSKLEREKGSVEHSNIKACWQAQCRAKWPSGGREFQHSAGF